MRFMTKYTSGVIIAIVAVFALSACTETPSDNDEAQKKEQQTQQQNYDQGVKSQPAHTMNYSPTRDTVNGWIDVWSKPGQLAYVYLSNDAGDITSYYVFKHPPVSYCTSLTPTYKIIVPDVTGDNTVPLSVPAPAMDKVYYSGGECNRYYGFDAVSGSYMEFTSGLGINMQMFSQPLPPQQLQNATPFGKAAAQQ